MTCIRSVSYSVVINGNPIGHIHPTRRIQQGDPISHYLFILCAEALSTLLCKVVDYGTITRVPTSSKGPRISHIIFVDDSFFFCKANSVEWRRFLRIFGVYEASSGQKLNFEKKPLFSLVEIQVMKKGKRYSGCLV
jgi:hypothetical protein